MSPISSKFRFGILVGCVLMLGGCTTLGGDPFSVHDPFEAVNRPVYRVIDGVDRRVIAPVARGYRTVMPDFAERGVGNFFRNLRRVDSVANSLLQGKVRHAAEDLTGLLINSTLGIGGLFDVGGRMGLKHEEDLGQTLAVWGVTRTRYVYLPSGPSSVRDTPGTLFKSYLPKLLLGGGYSIWISLVDLLAVRAEALPLSDARDQAALDPYVFTRDAYYQRREFVTYDGDPPVADFLDELDGVGELEAPEVPEETEALDEPDETPE